MNINPDELREWLPSWHIALAANPRTKSTLYAVPDTDEDGIHYHLLFCVVQGIEMKKATKDLNEAVEAYNQL